MVQYVVLVADDPNLFENVRDLLSRDHRCVVDHDEVHCEGSAAPLTNIYPAETTPDDWEGWEPSHEAAPDPRSSTTMLFQCRSADWVAEVANMLGPGLDSDVWLLDSADVLWPARSGRPLAHRPRLGRTLMPMCKRLWRGLPHCCGG